METYTYDPAYGDLLGIEATRNNQLLYRYTIEQRDNLGREKIRRESFNSPVGVQETRLRYDYDAAGRLSKVFSCPLSGDTSCSTNPTEVASYAYDDNGNLTTYPGFFNPVYDAQDRLLSTSTTTFSNNAEGWRTKTTFSVFTPTYTYHPTGHLLATQGQQGSASYRLDPLGRRIERKASSPTSRFLYRDALRPAAELTTANALRTRFVYATGRNVPDFLWRDGSFFRILTDPRGSVRMVVNVATGVVEQRMRHDAWGCAFFAGTRKESSEARDQSSRPAPSNFSSKTRCSRSHTPACCQSRSRRQQDTPLPQPISCGSSFHGMPVLSTKRIPMRAARLLMEGRPSLGRGRRGGRMGSTNSQSESGSSERAIEGSDKASFPFCKPGFEMTSKTLQSNLIIAYGKRA